MTQFAQQAHYPAANRPPRIELPTDAQVAAAAECLDGEDTRRELGLTALALFYPISENSSTTVHPSHYDPEHPDQVLSKDSWPFRAIGPLMTYTMPGRPSTAEERWRLGSQQWASASGTERPDIVLLSNLGGGVSPRTAALASVIKQYVPVVAWETISPPVKRLERLPVMHHQPRLLAAMAIILRQRRQPQEAKGEK